MSSEDRMIGNHTRRFRRWREHARKAMKVLVAAVREIFDENAYDRFLQRTANQRSVASYREFMRERDAAAVRKPRCC